MPPYRRTCRPPPVLERWRLVLRVFRMTLLLSILALGVLFALGSKDFVSAELAMLGALIISGWIALSAAACLLLQLVMLLRWRRERGRTAHRNGVTAAEN